MKREYLLTVPAVARGWIAGPADGTGTEMRGEQAGGRDDDARGKAG